MFLPSASGVYSDLCCPGGLASRVEPPPHPPASAWVRVLLPLLTQPGVMSVVLPFSVPLVPVRWSHAHASLSDIPQ